MSLIIILGAAALLLSIVGALTSVLGAVLDWHPLYVVGVWCWILAVLCGLAALTDLGFTAIAWAASR